MTSPTREKIARVIDPEAMDSQDAARKIGVDLGTSMAGSVRIALSKADEILSLLPEGRSEQDQEDDRTALEDLRIEYGHAKREATELAKWMHRTFYLTQDSADWQLLDTASGILTQVDNMLAGVRERLFRAEADLSAALLRIKAASKLTSDFTFVYDQGDGPYEREPLLGALKAISDALLSSAQGETKEGFDGLPELPCGEQPSPTVGATAALAGCHADRDGECGWIACPQILDNEPEATGRHCPLDLHDDEES